MPALKTAAIMSQDNPSGIARIRFLDSLRGIAVAAVLLNHVLCETSNALSSFAFGLGYCGVTLFFLVSGFIIPASLQQKASLGDFWANRFFRLYPSYWVSIALTYPFVSSSISTLFVNVTMLQGFVGCHNINPVYWTLTVEIVFYCMTSLIFLWGLSHRTIETVIVMVLFTIAFGLSRGLPLKVSYPVIRGIAVCTVGAVIYQAYFQRIPVSTLILTIVVALTMETFSDNNRWNDFSDAIGGVSAYCLFLICMKGDFAPRLLLFLSKISYPLYLTHLTVIATAPLTSNPLVNTTELLLASVALATAIHYLVEAPLMRRGKLYGRHFRPAFALKNPHKVSF